MSESLFQSTDLAALHQLSTRPTAVRPFSVNNACGRYMNITLLKIAVF